MIIIKILLVKVKNIAIFTNCFHKLAQYENSGYNNIENMFFLLLTVLGTVASVTGVILAIVFRIKDKNNHKMKESNRHAKAVGCFLKHLKTKGEPFALR